MKNNKLQKNILSNWQEVKLGDCLERIEGGGTPSKKNTDYWEGNIPWASVKDVVTHNSIDTQDHITEMGLKNSSSKLIKKGTLIVPTRMALGCAVIFDVDVAINQDLKALYPKKDLLKQFLLYWFKYKEEFIKRLGSGSTVSGIQQKELKNIKFDLPPLHEQQRIVAVLETWDQAIEKLSQKIEIKKQIKKALMQHLLTGKKRLPGFSDKWITVELGDVSDFVNGYTFKSSTYCDDGKYKIITIANVQDGFMIVTGAKSVEELPLNISSEQVLKKGDILISMTGNVGRVCVVDNDNCLLNQRVGKIQSKGIDKNLLYFFLHDRRFLSKMIDCAQGGAQANLSTGDIKEYIIDIPKSQEEQTAIAKILSKADEELSKLEQKLSLFKDQKKFLLNNLITGKIRTPENLKIK